ncbi:MAG TPA: ABC transporter substrate-binding protein [Acidimicrobiales bacterium]
MAGRRPLALALAAAALVAAACSDPPSSGGDGARTEGEGGDGGPELPECPLDALDEAGGPVEITLWYGGIGGPTEDTLEALIADFNASQDRVEVVASSQGASFAEVYRKFESAASADTGQLPDVVMLESTELQSLADGGLMLPAEACMEAAGYEITGIEPAVRSAFSVGDVLYPGYMNVSSQVLFYNKAHWEQAGLDPDDPPGTLDELVEAARALKEAGVSVRPLSFKAGHAVFVNWLAGEGVDVLDNDNGHDGLATEATFADPVAVEALATLQQMQQEGLLNAFGNVEGGIDHYLALVTEQSSMLIETSTASATIAQAVAGTITPEEAGIDFDASVLERATLVPGTAPFPGLSRPGRVSAGGAGFFIVGTSDPAEQAGSWAFLEYMLQPENAQRWHVEGGYLPVVKSVNDEPAVQAFWQEDMAGVLLQPAVEQLQDADPDQPGPLAGPYQDLVDEVQQAMEAVLFDGADPEAALTAAQEDVTESLERYAAE